jgi:hypothetical protein
VLEEKGEGEAHATCESRCTEDRLTKEAETRRRGGSDFRWRGGEATGGRRGHAQWGAERQWHVEQMEKKNEEKGGRGRWPTAFYGGPVAWAERKKGAGGPAFGAAWRGKRRRERRPRARRGTARAAGIDPGRRAQAVPLPHDRGGRRGASDLVRAADSQDQR